MDQDPRKLSDEMLIAILDKRVEFETHNEAEMIDYIREVMVRKLWREYGAHCMYDFMTNAHFHYASAVAQRKLDAARMMQDFPEVKGMMSEGEINLTQLGMLAQALRQKSVPLKVQREILESMRGQTVNNTRMILNESFEIKVKTRTQIRIQRDGSVRASMTFSKDEWEIVSRAKDVVSHSVPDGELPKVLTYCARFTLSKKDFSAPSSSQKSTSAGGSKPASSNGVSRVKRRYVFQKYKTCNHHHPDGRRCHSRYQLQVDHIISLWRGGTNDVENLQLLCGIHNRYKFEQETSQSHSSIERDPE